MEHSRPPPPSLGVSNASHTIKKPPLPPKLQPPRRPVIIHQKPPKIIRVRPENFKAIVQRLTGAPSRNAAIHKTPGQGPTIHVGSGPQNKPADIAGILPPVFPASLKPNIPQAYIVPSLLYGRNPVGLHGEPVYQADGNFLVRPGYYLSLPVVPYSGRGNLHGSAGEG